jgi:hypothetical protein
VNELANAQPGEGGPTDASLARSLGVKVESEEVAMANNGMRHAQRERERRERKADKRAEREARRQQRKYADKARVARFTMREDNFAASDDRGASSLDDWQAR